MKRTIRRVRQSRLSFAGMFIIHNVPIFGVVACLPDDSRHRQKFRGRKHIPILSQGKVESDTIHKKQLVCNSSP